MLYLDLDELDSMRSSSLFGVEKARPLSFHRSDYLGDPKEKLKSSVLEVVRSALGLTLDGAVRALTHVRSFGYVFNPVTFYYCFDRAGALRAVVSEITNTPWGERHRYVVAASGDNAEAEFDKAFHVSPFFPMQQKYRWRFRAPGPSLGVSMSNHEGDKEVFRATLGLRRRPFSTAELAKIALRQPLMSGAVHAAIYYQALRLVMKGAQFHSHPAPSARADDTNKKLPDGPEVPPSGETDIRRTRMEVIA